MIWAAFSALCCLPIASTKSPSGSTSQSANFHLLPTSALALTHQIKVDTMIHQVVHPRLRPLWRAKIYPILLTHILNALPRSRQAHDAWMEFCKVGFQNGRRVPRRVTRYEDGEKG